MVSLSSEFTDIAFPPAITKRSGGLELSVCDTLLREVELPGDVKEAGVWDSCVDWSVETEWLILGITLTWAGVELAKGVLSLTAADDKIGA